MTGIEQHIKLAAKLYKCRDAAKALYGNGYMDKLTWYKERIAQCQKEHEVDTLRAVLALCSLPSVKDSDITVMLFMAAAVEIIEPSKD